MVIPHRECQRALILLLSLCLVMIFEFAVVFFMFHRTAGDSVFVSNYEFSLCLDCFCGQVCSVEASI